MTSRAAPLDGIGDIDGSGFVDDTDLNLLMQYIAHVVEPTEDQRRRADVNGDGSLNALDITTMELYMYNVIDSFPASLKEEKPGRLGWDLPSSVTYTPGTDLPASIHITNMTNYEQEFALMTRLIDAAGVVLTDEAMKVDGQAWFTIEGTETKVLIGHLNLPHTGVTLVLSLCDKKSGTTIDSVQTGLVSPSASSPWPSTWPVTADPAVQSGWTDSFSGMMGTMLMMALFGAMIRGMK